MLDDADRQAERMVKLSHPLRVAFGQIVVDGDEMGAFALERVQIEGKRGDQCFSFTGFHFSDATLIQDHAADQLDVEVPHVQPAARHLPADGEGLGQNVIERFPRLEALLEILGLIGQPLIGQRRQGRLEAVDALDDRPQRLDLAIILASEDNI